MKKIIRIILLVVLLGGAYATYQYFKPHRDIQGEKPEFQLSGNELVRAYTSDENAANGKFLDKVVEVSGSVAEIDGAHIKLESGVYCNGDFSQANLKSGDQAKLKGRVVGYDEIFEEVTLDNTVLHN